MRKTTLIVLLIPLCFTMLVGWFAWSTFRSAPPLAAESLRGAGLSIAAAIENLAAADPSFRSLARYTTPDIAYFALTDRQGIVRFHTNAALIGHSFGEMQNQPFPDGISETRELLGTGEEVYLLRKRIHRDRNEYLLVLALHTYRSDLVIRRANTGVTVLLTLTVALWGVTALLLYIMRREENFHNAIRHREELARLGEMAAVMAHEIRNPLAGIKGFAQLVETAANMEQTRTYAGKIVKQSLRMEALVNDLLAFARDEQGHRQSVELSDLLEECRLLIQGEAANQRVLIEVTQLAKIRSTVVVDRIIQMLLNLMKNALQAMPDGGVLKIGLSQQSALAHISVSDTGVGIAPEHLPRIFEPFWTSKVNGTGLGLALCRKVAEEHGGSLKVESSVGKGSVFTVALPLSK
jgi:two-component system sensor histidine kinase HydH